MKIGDAAKLAGVKVQTLRYYERRGLIAEPTRSVGNYREFGEETVRRVRFIKRAQSLGFDLEQIRELLALRDAPGQNRKRVRTLAEGKVEELERELDRLERTRDALRDLIIECRESGRSRKCPILEAMDGSESLLASHPQEEAPT